MAARLAVDGVKLVALQPALRARVKHLATRAEDGLCQTEKQGDADEHHGNREQLAAHAPEQRDVSKACGGERRCREVERVNKVLDLRVDPVLSDKDQRGDHEHEHGQVQRSKDDLLIAAHGRELPLELPLDASLITSIGSYRSEPSPAATLAHPFLSCPILS